MSDGITPLDDGLGLTLERVEEGSAELRLDPTTLAVAEEYGISFLHGGALATCVDSASWYAAGEGAWVVSSLTLDCLRLARAEPHLIRATCRKTGRALSRVDVEIVAAADPERLVALGRVTLARSEV